MAGWYGVNIQSPDNAGLIATAMKANELAGQHYGNALKGLGSIISNSRDQERQAQKEIQASNMNMLNTLATARDREIKDLERQELKDKTLATNNALAILMDPSKATSLHTPASDHTTQNQINMYNQANSDGTVTPQEQALIDARYKEDLTKDISSNKSVDQSVLFNAQKQKEDLALKQQQLEADIKYKNNVLAEQRKVRKLEEDTNTNFAKYLKSVSEMPSQVLVPGSTTQGITNQGEIDTYAANLMASSDQYNKIVEDILSNRQLKVNAGYKLNPGSSVQIPIEKVLTGKALEDYAHEQAFKQTIGTYDFSKAPQAIYGEVTTPDKYIPKTREQLIQDRLNSLVDSGLPVKYMQSEFEKLFPTRTGPKTEKEALEIQKLQSEITKKDMETKKVQQELSEGKKSKDIPKDIGAKTADLLGTDDAQTLFKEIDKIAVTHKIPVANLYSIVDQLNNRTIEGWFGNVDEKSYRDLVANEIFKGYKINMDK